MSSAASAPYLSASALQRKAKEVYGEREQKENVLCIVIHNSCNAVHIKAVGLGRHPFPKPVGDMVRAQQSRHHHEHVSGHEAEYARIPVFQNKTLEIQKVL